MGWTQAQLLHDKSQWQHHVLLYFNQWSFEQDAPCSPKGLLHHNLAEAAGFVFISAALAADDLGEADYEDQLVG